MSLKLITFSVLSLAMTVGVSVAGNCPGLPRARLITCACTGAPAIGGYCVYYHGGACAVDILGNYCGSDDQGHSCYVGQTTDTCTSAPQARSTKNTSTSSGKVDIAALVPTCGGRGTPLTLEAVQVNEKLGPR